MKKFVLGAIGLMALAAPASAADLAARPYTKAPPPMVAAIYDWSGFYLGINGGWGSSHKCWDNNNNLGILTAPAFREGCTMRAEGWSAVRLDIVGKPPVGSSASKGTAIGRT